MLFHALIFVWWHIYTVLFEEEVLPKPPSVPLPFVPQLELLVLPQQFWRCTYWSNPLTQFPPNPGLAWVVTHPGLCSCKCACPKIMTKLRLTNSFPHASQQVILGMHNLDLCCCSCTNNQSATATSSATAERLWFCSMYPSDSVTYVFLNSNMYFSVFLMFFFKSVTVFFRFHIF